MENNIEIVEDKEYLTENKQSEKLENKSDQNRSNEKNQYFKISGQIFSSYLFNIMVIISQPLLLALLTRILSVEDYGIYSLLFGTISLLSVFLRYGVSEYIRNKLPGLPEEIKIRKIMLIITFFSGLFLLGGIILYLIKKWSVQFLKISDYPELWIISIILIILIAEYEMIDSYLISIKKIILSSFLSFLIKCLWVIILMVSFFLYGNFSLDQVFAVWLLGIIFTLGISLWAIRKEMILFLNTHLHFEFLELYPILRFILPLCLVVFSSWMIDVANKYIINQYLGRFELGIYSLAYGLVSSIVTVPIIFQNVIQPYFAEKWNLKEDPSLLFNVMLKYTLLTCIPMMVGLFILRKNIVLLISGEKYLAAVPLIIALLPFALFSAMIYIYDRILMLKNLIKEMVIIYILAAAIIILLNIFLIPRFGITAAAISTSTTYFMVFLVMHYLTKEIKFHWDYLKIGRIIITSLLMGILMFGINLWFNLSRLWEMMMIILGGMIFFGILGWFLNTFSKEEKELAVLGYHKLRNSFSKRDRQEILKED